MLTQSTSYCSPRAPACLVWPLASLAVVSLGYAILLAKTKPVPLEMFLQVTSAACHIHFRVEAGRREMSGDI